MKLPNRKNAYVSKEKITDYLLSETHPVGSAKAKFFRSLGFDETYVDQLRETFLQIARKNDMRETRKFLYGTNYVIMGKIKTPSGKNINIKTVWFIKSENSSPSFVTAYPV